MADSGAAAPSPIDIAGVALRFGDTVALRDVSLSAARGTVTGLVGHNGAGKSTLINLLAGLLSPDAGRVRLLGRDPADQSEGPTLLRQVGFLLEDEALFEYLTGREFLEFVGYAFDIPATERARRIATLGTYFSLGPDLERLVDEYSTGMRKKLAIAAAMLPAPAVLVLDEPFESLDPSMVRRLTTALRTFASRGGTVLLSSHLLTAVEKACDCIVFLNEGRVVANRSVGPQASGNINTGADDTLDAVYSRVIAEEIVEMPDWLVASPSVP
jgi:ABC-2 type transport system ATP-binding protein